MHEKLALATSVIQCQNLLTMNANKFGTCFNQADKTSLESHSSMSSDDKHLNICDDIIREPLACLTFGRQCPIKISGNCTNIPSCHYHIAFS